MKLSRYFTLSEMTFSQTAIRRGINNIPTPLQQYDLQQLCVKILDPIREHFNKPIRVTSGFRNRKLNKVIGGSPNSQHTEGKAADFVIPQLNLVDVFKWIALESYLEFDQLILEFDKWIHISYDQAKTRKQVMRAVKKKTVVGQRTKYIVLNTKEINLL